jgi:tight adherence protein C
MNFIQQQLDALSLQLPASPALQLGIGVAVLVVLYCLYKLIQWGFRRKQASVRRRAVRPRRESRKEAATKPVSEKQRTPAAVMSPERELVGAAAGISDPIESSSAHSGPTQQSRRYASSPFWPAEPKETEKRSLFDEPGEEYPWADGSDYSFGSLTPVLSTLLPITEDGRRTLIKALRNAGYYSPHAWENLAAIRYLGIVIPILLFGILLVLVPERFEVYAITGLVIGPMIGWALPALYVRSKAVSRLREIENAMPDMLDLLNMCVSQGMTVPASLRRVGQDIRPVYPALSKELAIVADQARIGHITEAMENFSHRVDTPEVHSFSSLMIQTEQMGTSVSQALTEYSDSMRETQKQRADQKANAATFKLLFPTVLCLMPAVFLFLMGPSLIELNRFFTSGGIQGLDNGAAQAIEQQLQRSQPPQP